MDFMASLASVVHLHGAWIGRSYAISHMDFLDQLLPSPPIGLLIQRHGMRPEDVHDDFRHAVYSDRAPHSGACLLR